MQRALECREITGNKGVAIRVADESTNAYAPSPLRQFQTRCPLTLNYNGISVADLDLPEGRWLLSGTTNGAIAAYDVLSHYSDGLCRPPGGGGNVTHDHTQLFYLHPQRYSQSTQKAHHGAITCVQWYHIDASLFVTSSVDCTVKLWDANALVVVLGFRNSDQVTCAALSRVATRHTLLAVCSREGEIRLADPKSGSFIQSYSGHTGDVGVLCWSTYSEWILVSGGSDGQIRYWDVRKSGCLLCLDQNNAKTYIDTHTASPDLIHLERRRLESPSQRDFSSFQYQRKLQGFINSRNLLNKYASQGASHGTETVIAHNSGVTALCPSEDGLFLHSASRRSADIKRWDFVSGRNMLVKFDVARENARRTYFRMALSECGRKLFVPHNRSVYCMNVLTGSQVYKMNAHYDTVTACIANPHFPELYTCALDGMIMAWEPKFLAAQERGRAEETGNRDRGRSGANAHAHNDNNSDDWTTDEDL